jgi:hypothetical protein
MENIVLYSGNLVYFTPFGIFYGQLVILHSFGIFVTAFLYCTKKNLATLSSVRTTEKKYYRKVFVLS